MGRSFLGKGFRVRGMFPLARLTARAGIYEIQKTDKRPAFWFESDPESSFYIVVVSNHQSGKCVRWFPSATGSYWNLYARKDSYPQDFSHPDL